MFKTQYILFFICLPVVFYGQIGGKNAFEFINFPTAAKVSGLGGNNITIKDGDPNMIFFNPALLNTDMRNKGAISYYSYYADISATSLAYTFNTKKTGLLGVGLQYVGYGSAKATDASGNYLGTVSANEYAFTISKSHTIDNYSLGANLKFAGSQIAGYNAYAILADIGGVFTHPKKNLTIGLLIKNIGFPISSYSSGNTVAMPFDVQAGMTFKPEHMPFRFSFTLHHLYRYNIAYDDPNLISGYDLNGNPIINHVSVADNIARHFVFGAELLLAKGFNIRAGYNHLKRAELSTDSYGGLAGFSFGFMLKVKAFEFGYTRAFYSAVGGNNNFSLVVNFNNFHKKAASPVEKKNEGGSM